MITRAFQGCVYLISHFKNRRNAGNNEINQSTALLEQNLLSIEMIDNEEKKSHRHEEINKILPGLSKTVEVAQIAQNEAKSTSHIVTRIRHTEEKIDSERDKRQNRIVNAATAVELIGLGIPTAGILLEVPVLIFMGALTGVIGITTDIYTICILYSSEYFNNTDNTKFLNSLSDETVHEVGELCSQVGVNVDNEFTATENLLENKRVELEQKVNNNLIQLDKVKYTAPLSVWFHTVFAPSQGFPRPISETILQYAEESFEKPIMDGQVSHSSNPHL